MVWVSSVLSLSLSVALTPLKQQALYRADTLVHGMTDSHWSQCGMEGTAALDDGHGRGETLPDWAAKMSLQRNNKERKRNNKSTVSW